MRSTVSALLLALFATAPSVVGAQSHPDHGSPAGHAGHPVEATPESHDHAAMTPRQMLEAMSSPDGCSPGREYFHLGMAMCLPRPREAGAWRVMWMGNAFLAGIAHTGARGEDNLATPNWLMVNAGRDVAAWARLELDLMLTAERWTFPERGYPLLLQIGEHDERERPYVDAQHPHSSPIMGLALTGVLRLGDAGIARLWFAPRGEATDGPIAFMHRPTAMPNPDAPLGHHLGQDAGHISSTVLGLSLLVGGTYVEASTFHGREPEPAHVDLPFGRPDSAAVRLAQHVGPHLTLAASYASVGDPEGDAVTPRQNRVSASAYARASWPAGWRLHGALIWGGITDYERVPFLSSVTAEGVLKDHANAVWTRMEAVERTPGQLLATAPRPDDPTWAGALTLGYSRRLFGLGPVDFAAGGSGTATILPAVLEAAYGGSVAWSGRVFLQAQGVQMFEDDRRVVTER